MRRHLIAGALALAFLSLPGCATLQRIESAVSIATGPNVTPQQIYVAVNAFDAAEVLATNYLRLPRCPQAVACRDPIVSKQVITWVRAGRIDRNKLKAGLRAAPGQNISLVTVYNDLQGIASQIRLQLGN